MKKVFLKFRNDYYIPDQSSFTTVNTFSIGGDDRPKAERIPITKFVIGQKYAGVLIRKKLDHQGNYGVSDLFYFKRLIGGSSQANNIQLGEGEDLVAVDNNVVLKQELRKIDEGQLIVIEYKGQAPPPKRYKMWGIYVDVNYKNSNYKKAQPQQQYQQQQYQQFQPQQNNSFVQQNPQNTGFNTQQPSQNTGSFNHGGQNHQQSNYTQINDDLPF